MHFEELWEGLEVNNSTLNHTWYFQFLGFGDWEILGSFGNQQINGKSRTYILLGTLGRFRSQQFNTDSHMVRSIFGLWRLENFGKFR